MKLHNEDSRPNKTNQRRHKIWLKFFLELMADQGNNSHCMLFFAIALVERKMSAMLYVRAPHSSQDGKGFALKLRKFL